MNFLKKDDRTQKPLTHFFAFDSLEHRENATKLGLGEGILIIGEKKMPKSLISQLKYCAWNGGFLIWEKFDRTA